MAGRHGERDNGSGGSSPAVTAVSAEDDVVVPAGDGVFGASDVDGGAGGGVGAASGAARAATAHGTGPGAPTPLVDGWTVRTVGPGSAAGDVALGEDATADLDRVQLGDDPFDDDLAEQLRARAAFPVTRTTVALAGLVLVVGGFVGGVLVEKHFGAKGETGNTLPAAFASRAAAGGFGGAGGGRAGTGGTGAAGGGTNGQSGPATTGTVTLVDGATMYITTASGDVVIVRTTSATTVRSQQSAALKNIKVGATVSVVGTAGSDGSVTASQVTEER